MSRLESMEIKPEGLGHALYDHRLAVPMYQRSYAWKDDNVKDLFQDFARAVRDDSEYFLGTIVTAKGTNGRPEIVDGQQRLATTSILLAAIRDYFIETKDAEGASIIEGKYLLSKELKTREPVPHLKLNEFDGDFFTKCILRPPGPNRREPPTRESHRRILGAAKIAKQHVADILKGYSRDDHADQLNRWVQFIHEKAKVIWLTVSDYSDAYVIFETLNDRGLELSTADLLKNYLFWKSGDRVKEVQQNWSLMTGILESVSTDDVTKFFVHQLWSSFYGVTRSRELFKEVREKIKTKQAAIDLVKQLVGNARLYAALRNPDHEYWNPFGTPTRESLRELGLIRVWQIRTLLLAVLAEFSQAEAKKVFPLAVNWSVRFLIAGGSPGTIETHYAKQAVRVRQGEIKNARDLARAMATGVPDDTTFENAFSTARVSADYLARYLLRRMNDYVGSQGNSVPPKMSDETVVNLEHVFPKNPETSLWGYIGQEEGEEIVRRIGNLALITSKDNSKLGNAGFEEKAKVYKVQPFPLTQDLATFASWGRNQVNDYQKKLAKVAGKVWGLGT